MEAELPREFIGIIQCSLRRQREQPTGGNLHRQQQHWGPLQGLSPGRAFWTERGAAEVVKAGIPGLGATGTGSSRKETARPLDLSL